MDHPDRRKGFGIRWRRLCALAAALLAAALVAAGCGSSDAGDASTGSGAGSSGGSGDAAVQRADAAVAAAMKNPTGWHGPDRPVRAERGKRFVIVSCSQATSGCSTVAKSAAEGAQRLGWNTTILDGRSDPEVYNSSIKQAITLKADGLLIVGIDQSLVGDAIRQAKAAGIKVVSAGQDNEPGNSPDTVDADVREPNDVPGNWIADWMIKDTGGKAKVLALNAPEYKVIGPDLGYFKRQLANCSDCEVVKEQDINLASAATSLAQQVGGILQSNPDVNYVYMPFSDLLPYVEQAIQTVNRTGQIKVADVSCQLPGPKSLRARGAETACIAVPYEWLGWSATDLMVRLMAGERPGWRSEVPFKLLTADNVFPDGEFWDGGYDFRRKYEQLWGVS